jgi:hypothetical protein
MIGGKNKNNNLSGQKYKRNNKNSSQFATKLVLYFEIKLKLKYSSIK